MCGIVGLLVKKPELRESLGRLMVPMMVEMAARGPESAGLAVFTGPIGAERRKFSLYAPSWSYDWSAFEADGKAMRPGPETVNAFSPVATTEPSGMVTGRGVSGTIWAAVNRTALPVTVKVASVVWPAPVIGFVHFN